MKDVFRKKFFLPLIMTFLFIGCIVLGGTTSVAYSEVSLKYSYDGTNDDGTNDDVSNGFNAKVNTKDDTGTVKEIIVMDDIFRVSSDINFDNSKFEKSEIRLILNARQFLPYEVDLYGALFTDVSFMNTEKSIRDKIIDNGFGFELGSKDKLFDGMLEYKISIPLKYMSLTAHKYNTKDKKLETNKIFVQRDVVAAEIENKATDNIGLLYFGYELETKIPLEMFDVFFLNIEVASSLGLTNKHLAHKSRIGRGGATFDSKSEAKTKGATKYIESTAGNMSPIDFGIDFGVKYEFTVDEDNLTLLQTKFDILVDLNPVGKVFFGSDFKDDEFTDAEKKAEENVFSGHHFFPCALSKSAVNGFNKKFITSTNFELILKNDGSDEDKFEYVNFFAHAGAGWNFGKTWIEKDSNYNGIPFKSTVKEPGPPETFNEDGMDFKTFLPMDVYAHFNLKPIEYLNASVEFMINAPFGGHKEKNPYMYDIKFEVSDIFDLMIVGIGIKAGVNNKDLHFADNRHLVNRLKDKDSVLIKNTDTNTNGSIKYSNPYKGWKLQEELDTANESHRKDAIDKMRDYNSVLNTSFEFGVALKEYGIEKLLFTVDKAWRKESLVELPYKAKEPEAGKKGDSDYKEEVPERIKVIFNKDLGNWIDSVGVKLDIKTSMPEESGFEWANAFTAKIGVTYALKGKTRYLKTGKLLEQQIEIQAGKYSTEDPGKDDRHENYLYTKTPVGFYFLPSIEIKYDPKKSPLEFIKFAK